MMHLDLTFPDEVFPNFFSGKTEVGEIDPFFSPPPLIKGTLRRKKKKKGDLSREERERHDSGRKREEDGGKGDVS